MTSCDVTTRHESLRSSRPSVALRFTPGPAMSRLTSAPWNPSGRLWRPVDGHAGTAQRTTAGNGYRAGHTRGDAFAYTRLKRLTPRKKCHGDDTAGDPPPFARRYHLPKHETADYDTHN